MGFLFGLQKKESIVAIFDIGSGSVGGALVQIPLNGIGIPVILKSIRIEIKSREEFNFKIFMDDMLASLDSISRALYNFKLGAPEEIICVLASPWYISETRTVKMTKDKSFIFTKRKANELIQKEIFILNNLYKKKYSSLENIPELIEQHIMAVYLNGYMIDNPLGMKCKTLEMNMLISLSPKICLNKIRDIFSNIYHHTDVSFSSFTVDSYLAIRDKYLSQSSYLLIDVSGEVTDVGIVTKGVLKSVLSFPFGRKTFFKYMCTKLKIELRDAEELFKLYNNGHLSDELKNKIESLLKTIENLWGESFRQCISTLPHTLILPGTIFLTADNDIRNWFSNVLQNEKYIQSMVLDHKCNVVSLDGFEFINMCNIKEGPCDPFLMIESISVMRKMSNK